MHICFQKIKRNFYLINVVPLHVISSSTAIEFAATQSIVLRMVADCADNVL